MFIILTKMSDFKVYAQHNSLTVTGRVVSCKIVNGKNGEFLALALLHNSEDDDQTGIEYRVTLNGGLLSFVKKGYDLNKRMLTVTGHMTTPEAYYTDAEGAIQLLTRPRVKMTDCVVMPGGLGAGPKKMNVKAPVRADVVIKPAPAVVRVEKAQAAPIDEIDEIADEIPAEAVGF